MRVDGGDGLVEIACGVDVDELVGDVVLVGEIEVVVVVVLTPFELAMCEVAFIVDAWCCCCCCNCCCGLICICCARI